MLSALIFAAEQMPPSLMDKLTDPIVLVALITTCLGAVLVKVIDALLGKGKVKADLAAQIRDELRKDMLTLRTNFENCEEETDKWQDKYWLTVEENAQLKAAQALINAKVAAMGNIMKDEHPEHPEIPHIDALPD